MNVQVTRDESPLGSWVLARMEPGIPSWAVEGIWCFEGRLNLLRERHFPSGRLDLVVHLGTRFRDATHGGGEFFPARCLSGLQLRPDVVEAPPEATSVVGIRLHPLGAYALVGGSAGELGEGTGDLDLLLGGASRELGERCHAAPTVEERVRVVAGWVAGRVAGGPTPDPAVQWMVTELERRGGRARIAELRERTGWSATRLTQVFRREVGVTPKVFARIVRFRTAMERLAAGEEDLSRVAHAAGYYDQPHFNGEFRSLAGMTPSDYLSGLRFPGARSLAEEGP
jgi:AraC-like DNA-binding protein